MCFSAEASFGAAAALLPAGGYCVETAWRKDRRYLPLAAVPVLFGAQQLCEALVWTGLGRGQPDTARVASLGYLFFALALWPVWVPLAVAAVETWVANRRACLALAGAGLIFALVYYLPVTVDGGRGLNPAMVGHSIRYDLSAVPATRSIGWWVWPTLYLLAVAGPFLASHNRRLRPLGAAVVGAAVVAQVAAEYAFASVWCFFSAFLSLHLAYVLHRLPETPGIPEPIAPLAAL